MTRRSQILVRGIVQGVGFRPFVYDAATRHALRGRVLNTAAGVLIDVEGEPGAVERFVDEIAHRPPPLADIESIECAESPDAERFDDFRIVESDDAGPKLASISADVATCDDCLRELFDPTDRRHRYPFVNCTNCGPRFTIVEGVPYDRAKTTMREFPMCAACEAEYRDVRDRRFHAEPTACPACGPRATLVDADGQTLDETPDAVAATRALLLDGKIVAIKGIGGFHLACDATNAEAVELLRSRKVREDKPFAIMAPTLDAARALCEVSPEEAKLLSSPHRPIVLLARRDDVELPSAIAPGVRTLGVMLPYSPLHHLLVEGLDRPLVMTSGNVSDEPIAYEDDDARERLAHLADAFLVHDRRIHMRADDSVARVADDGRPTVLRRSRGYAPAPIRTTFAFPRHVLACGAELKNTFCLARGNLAFVSHHVGDLENLETLASYERGIAHYTRLFDVAPEIVAHDLHPEYLSTKYALALGDEAIERVGVQHHHAHVASCLADNGADGEVIGVAMDGLGFGSDGKLWGGEFLVASTVGFERVAHLAAVPMPGGAKAIREPWRMAAVYLSRALGERFLDANIPFVRALDRTAWATLRRMCETGINSPETSSMGRLFDAVAAAVGLRSAVRYEGQAAIELEAIADPNVTDGYAFEVADDGVVSAEPVLRRIVEDLTDDAPASVVSARFHNGVATLVATVAERIRAERGLARVALSGGVFQNVLLVARTRARLVAAGFEVLTHHRVPPNDGGISLGQAAVASAITGSGRS